MSILRNHLSDAVTDALRSNHSLRKRTLRGALANIKQAEVDKPTLSARSVLEREKPTEKLLRGLNGILPWDIRVRQVKQTTMSFHAQKNARKKRYEYRIYNGLVLSPFYHGYFYHLIPELKMEAMHNAAERIIGLKNFRGFSASASKIRNTYRQVFLSRFRKRGKQILYQIEATGFLHHMVRNIVGTLVEVGLEKRSPLDIEKIFKTKDRRNAGPTAPAHGLYLVKVWY